MPETGKPDGHLSPAQPRVTTQDIHHLLDTYVRAAEDLVSRPLQLLSDSMRRALSLCQQGLLGQNPPMHTARTLAQEYANLLAGLVTTVPYVLENMAGRLDDPPIGALGLYDIPVSGAEPADHGTQAAGTDADGQAWSYALPTRTIDASQGWAGWFVPTAKVAGFMHAARDRGLIEGVAVDAFTPVDCAGRSLVVVQATDYRVGDLGPYCEIGLLLWVTPAKSVAAQPGMLFVSLAVSAPQSVAPAAAIWGLPKQCAASLAVCYGPEGVEFYTGDGELGDFSLMLPRFGEGRSLEIPILIFSAAPQDPWPPAPKRSIFRRNGDGEGLQYGGAVRLQLGRPPGAAGPPSSCFCRDGGRCLCDALRDLLPVDAPSQAVATLPAANGWTETMSGTLGRPGGT